MQRFKTPLNNKENEKASGTTPLRLKINYEARQKFHERSKSPLRESSMNKKLQSFKENSIHRFSNKNIEIQSKFVEDFEASPSMKFLNDKDQSLKQSAAQLSKIKPISLSVKKNQIPDLRKLEQKNKQDTFKSDFSTFNNQPSRHRQNSKHLGFSAKVNNLQKINHQISSLLDYVYQNKPKEKLAEQRSVAIKPRYADIDQNAKVYQRRVSALQKVEENEPRVSIFNVQAQEQRQIQTQQRKNQNKYEYLNYENLNRNNVKNFQQNKEETYTINRRQNSQDKISNLSSKNLRQYQILKKQFQIPKTQPIQQVLTGTFQNQQQFSKATNQNPDLEFYYESLKKRDQDIENFKKKVYNDLDTKQRNDISRSNQKSISLPRHQRLKYKYDLDRKDRQNDNISEKSSKKDIFVTKQQIQIYKDISKMQHSENVNSRTPSIKRFDRSPSNSSSLRDQKEEISKIQKIETPYNKIDHGFEKQSQRKIYEEDMQRVLGRRLNRKEMSSRKFEIEQQPQTSLTSKIDEQIQKIKNQLKDCTKEKNQLRQKYGDILSKERSSQIRQYQHSSKKQVNRFQQNDFQGNTFNHDNQEKYTINDFRQQRIQKDYLPEQLDNHFEKNQFQMRRNEVQRQFIRDQKPEFQGQRQRETQYHDQKFEGTQSKALSRISRQESKPNTIRIVEDCLSQQRESHRGQITFEAQRPERPQNNGYSVSKSPLKSKPQIEITVVQSARQYQVQKPLTPISSKSSKVFQLKVQKIQITKPQVTKLGNLVAERIQIDLKLRQQREKLMKNSNSKKWQQLAHYLARRYNRSMNPIEWQQMLQISPEEHNPFSPSQMSSMSSKSIRNFKQQQNEFDEDFSAIGSLINESMDFFELRLRNKFSAGQLRKQKFNFQQLDLSGKGYLSLEDLICFVNLHSGKFYRNRDIIFFVKNILILEESHHSNDLNNQGTASNYSSSKGSFDYRLSYEFLWNVLTYDQ